MTSILYKFLPEEWSVGLGVVAHTCNPNTQEAEAEDGDMTILTYTETVSKTKTPPQIPQTKNTPNF